MRTLIIILILAGAALAAWFLLQGEDASGGGNSSAAAAAAALDQIGQNKLEEQQLKNLNSFYQDEYDNCYSACKKSNCGWFARKCKGRCKTDCLAQLQERQGLSPTYNPTTGIKTPGALVRPYNPLLA